MNIPGKLTKSVTASPSGNLRVQVYCLSSATSGPLFLLQPAQEAVKPRPWESQRVSSFRRSGHTGSDSGQTRNTTQTVRRSQGNSGSIYLSRKTSTSGLPDRSLLEGSEAVWVPTQAPGHPRRHQPPQPGCGLPAIQLQPLLDSSIHPRPKSLVAHRRMSWHLHRFAVPSSHSRAIDWVTLCASFGSFRPRAGNWQTPRSGC
jgi:hypothetical protein